MLCGCKEVVVVVVVVSLCCFWCVDVYIIMLYVVG